MVNESKIDVHALDAIFNSIVRTMDQSKNDIFIISEQSRESFNELKLELEEIREHISIVITEGDHLDGMTRLSRKRLADVSKNFATYSEDQIREAYEIANDLQVRFSINKMEEKSLRVRRDDLDRRLAGLLDTMERADQLVNQVSVVIQYLTSDLKNVGEALYDARQQQEFGIRIIQAQEEERKRLSRDIHDGPAQMLANVLLRTGLIEKTHKERGAVPALEELSKLKFMVRDALVEVRRIIYDLRPMALDDLGLIPTLKKYLSKLSEYEQDTVIHFRDRGETQRFHSDLEIAAFRLIQEAVANAIKHGNAKDIWVKIEWLNDIMNINVKDNGVGFDPNEKKDKSFGLIGMRERIGLLKGEMKIITNPESGTSILFRIPIKGDKMNE
ncbi:sensor histidine kinase [Sporosarcina sp. CAU 1771]